MDGSAPSTVQIEDGSLKQGKELKIPMFLQLPSLWESLKRSSRVAPSSKVPRRDRFATLQHLDCEGLGFDDRWRLLRGSGKSCGRSDGNGVLPFKQWGFNYEKVLCFNYQRLF